MDRWMVEEKKGEALSQKRGRRQRIYDQFHQHAVAALIKTNLEEERKTESYTVRTAERRKSNQTYCVLVLNILQCDAVCKQRKEKEVNSFVGTEGQSYSFVSLLLHYCLSMKPLISSNHKFHTRCDCSL